LPKQRLSSRRRRERNKKLFRRKLLSPVLRISSILTIPKSWTCRLEERAMQRLSPRQVAMPKRRRLLKINSKSLMLRSRRQEI